MSSVTVLSDREKREIKDKLRKYSNVNDIDPDQHVFDKDMSNGEVNIRFFPKPESGEPEGIFFEISVNKNCGWYDENLGSYSSDNMENGGSHYQALSSELKRLVRDALGKNTEFVKKKGHGCFSSEVRL